MASDKNKATLLITGQLRDFIKAGHDPARLQVVFRLHPAAKDIIESQGIPHVEVYALSVNGDFCWLDYNLQNGDLLKVYGKETAEELQSTKLVRSPREVPTQFLADVHLGKLVRLLRLLGIDTQYSEDMTDEEIARKAAADDRAVLSRDLGLLKRGEVDFGYWLRSDDPDEQLREILDYFNLWGEVDPFRRCMKCNGALKLVPLEKVEKDVPPKVKEWCDEYRQCQQCGQVYWKGSHFEKLVEKVNSILGADYSVEEI